MFGAEKLSRLGVGLFALLLVGGLAAFFTGAFDSFLGTQQKAVTKPPLPFPKPPQATTPNPIAVANPPATQVVPSAAAKASVAKAAVTPLPTVAVVTPLPAKTDSTAPIKNVATTTPAVPPKPKTAKPARQRDLDLRGCLELADNLAIAQCAYKQP